MPNVRFVDGLKYGFTLFGFLLGLLVVSGMLIGGGVFAFSSANLVRIMNGTAATSQYGLVVGGGLATLLGVAVLYAGLIGSAYKLIADGVTEGMGNAGPSSEVEATGAVAEGSEDDPIGTDADVDERAGEGAATGATAAATDGMRDEPSSQEQYEGPTVGSEGRTTEDRQTVQGTATEGGAQARATGEDSRGSGKPEPGHQRDDVARERDDWDEYGQSATDDTTSGQEYREPAGQSDARDREGGDEWEPREATTDLDSPDDGRAEGGTAGSRGYGDQGGQDEWEATDQRESETEDTWDESTGGTRDTGQQDEWEPPEVPDDEPSEQSVDASTGEETDGDREDLWAEDEETAAEPSDSGTAGPDAEGYYTDSRPGKSSEPPTEESVEDPGAGETVDETLDEESSTATETDAGDEEFEDEFEPAEETDDYEDTSDEAGDWEPLDEDDL